MTPHALRRAFLLLGLGALVVACGKSAAEGQSTSSGTTSAGSEDCPKDLLAAVGKPCVTDGKTCSTSGSQNRMLMCSGKKWTEMAVSSPPPPT